MSTSHDNHAAPAAHASASTKKTPGQIVSNIVATFLVVAIGLVVLAMLFGSFLPMIFDSFGQASEDTAAAMVRSGQAVGAFGGGIRSWFNGISKITMAVIIGILPYAFGGFLTYILWKKWKDGQGGGGHHPAPAAPAAPHP